MIDLATDDSLLRRFARDLAATAPRATPVRPDLSSYGARDRGAARLCWVSRITDEYRSVAVFAELLRLLADIEAPFAAQCAVHRLIGDELRHTQLTAEVVDWLGGCEDLAIDLSDISLPPAEPGESAAVRAVNIVGRELVVVEEESLCVLAAYRDATTAPAIREVLAQILADEVRHAAAGRAILGELSKGALGAATAEARRELADTMAADRATLRATYRELACGGPGRALGASIELADLEAIWRRARS